VLILLPPSEGKSAPRRGKPLDLSALSSPALEAPRAEVLDALVALSTTDRAAGGTTGAAEALARAVAVLGVGKTLTAEVARNAALGSAPAGRADRVYTGVLYEALDLPSLTGPARRRASSRLAIVSGLFGLVRPADHIPAYRLGGDVNLPGIGPVSTFWARHLDGPVREAAGRGLVVDLRSSTYASFWRPDPPTARRVVTVRVLHEVDGRRKVVSHFNKATKGRLVRALLEDGANPRTPAAFADHLAALGWKAESGVPGRHGTPVDVIVTEL
jgi:uncharacterized protein